MAAATLDTWGHTSLAFGYHPLPAEKSPQSLRGYRNVARDPTVDGPRDGRSISVSYNTPDGSVLPAQIGR
jgi:hypothetical protein